MSQPGSADVPVGTANGQANEQSVNDTALSPHSHANGDVGAPGGNGDDSVMHPARNPLAEFSWHGLCEGYDGACGTDLTIKFRTAMKTSRRVFISSAARCGAGAGLTTAWAGQARAAEPAAEPKTYQIQPIGTVEKSDQGVRIRIFDAYVDGLLGLQEWSHVNVFYWFDQNDTPQQRRILRVHPQGNQANPLTGVFACRAPVRPNLIALSVCKVLAVEKNLVTLDAIDAFAGTPIIDLKPFIPPDAPIKD